MRAGVTDEEIISAKKRAELVPTSFRIPRDLMASLDQVAAETGHTRSEVMIRFMRHSLKLYLEQKRRSSKRHRVR